MNKKEESIHILLIDDDEIYLKVNELIIQSMGLESVVIYKFKNGQEALEHIDSQISYYKTHKCIILLDLNMPVMNGWGFLDHLNKINFPQNTNIEIYIVTSSMDNRDIESLKQYSVVFKYLNKPLSRSDYVELLGLNVEKKV